jgi:hypothetical protein
MAEAAPDYQQPEEFWKPLPGPKLHTATASTSERLVCSHCHSDLILGARFCHLCGADQQFAAVETPPLPAHQKAAARLLANGFGPATLVALILGIACLVVAVSLGFLYKVTTLSDWQAIQLWRIEWLLGALVLFAGGILIKKVPSQKR